MKARANPPVLADADAADVVECMRHIRAALMAPRRGSSHAAMLAAYRAALRAETSHPEIAESWRSSRMLSITLDTLAKRAARGEHGWCVGAWRLCRCIAADSALPGTVRAWAQRAAHTRSVSVANPHVRVGDVVETPSYVFGPHHDRVMVRDLWPDAPSSLRVEEWSPEGDSWLAARDGSECGLDSNINDYPPLRVVR